MKTFAQFLLDERERLGMTQVELAAALQVHPRTVGNWEGGAEPHDLTRQAVEMRLADIPTPTTNTK